MRPSEKIELDIYNFLKPRFNPSAPVWIGELTAQLKHTGLPIERILVGLEYKNAIVLSKFDVGSQRRFSYAEWMSAHRPQNEFFYTGGNFLIDLGPGGTDYFERLEEESQKENQEPLVFISCGQYLDREKKLGKDLAAAVTTAGYEAYFAETKNTLENLTRNIFGSLNRCAAFVGVMHHRGTVEPLAGEKYPRGSLWVEQEIAIAAFLTEIFEKKIDVLIYLQRGIKLEGIREQLKLEPVAFDSEDDVLLHFKECLASSKFKPQRQS